MAEKKNVEILEIKVTATGQLQVDGVTMSVKKATAAVRDFAKANENAANANKNLVNKSGLAGAAVTEIGRTISDSNYGIQGMANNLSQLGSLMTTLISTSGGLVGGIKALFGAMMGPLGILIAFQTILAVMERASKANQKLNKGFYDAEKAYASAAGNLRVLRDVVDDNNLSLEEKQRAIKKANEEYEDLNLVLDENGKLTEASTKAIDAKIEAMAREAKARAILKTIEEEYAKQAEMSAKDSSDFVGFWDQAKAGFQVAIGNVEDGYLGLAEAGKEAQTEAINQSKETVTKLTELLKKEDMVDEIFKGKEGGRGRKTANKVFKQIFLDLAKLEEKYRQDSLKADLLTEEEKIELNKANAIKELEIAHNTYLEKRKIKLKEFLESKASEKAKIDAQKKYDEEVIAAAQSVADVKVQIEAATVAEYKLLGRTRAEQARLDAEAIIEIEKSIALTKRQYGIQDIKNEIKHQEMLVQAAKEGSLLRAQAELKLAELKESLRKEEFLANAERGEFVNKQLQVATDFVDSEFQRQLDIEQNKTTALNNELRKRLDNENLSKDERAAIQGQIAANDEKLRVKQEKIEKKRFYMQKAANIAMAVVDTYVAANKVLAQQPGGIISKTAAMVAVIAAGLLNVATIARQQFKASASTAGGGAGGSGSGSGAGVQPPDFNIVGASQSRQLADVVEGQLNRPIKTYVVSSEVSTAQSLDRNIVEGASI